MISSQYDRSCKISYNYTVDKKPVSTSSKKLVHNDTVLNFQIPSHTGCYSMRELSIKHYDEFACTLRSETWIYFGFLI